MTANWLKVSLLLCIFGFFRELRPSEPFATEFFITHRNLTSEQITREIYPFGTYMYMSQLVIIFLITDLLRYKPIIIYSAIAGMIAFALMSWTNDVVFVYILQVFFGSFMASEVAYYTYIYAKVERSKYQLVTGQTRSAILSGRFIGAVLAQVCVSAHWLSYLHLTYLSFTSQCISLIVAILLPSVGVSIYFHSNQDSRSAESSNQLELNPNQKDIENNADNKPKFSFRAAISLLAAHIKSSYSIGSVFQWSIWWALAMCGFLQAQSYIQLLWKDIDPNEVDLYNGAVEAAITLLGAIVAFLAGFLDSKQFNRYDIWILSLCAAIEGCLLFWAGVTNELWCAYCAYILFGMLYHFMITTASATVAKKLHDDCFALIFGINTLVALILQSLLTLVTITILEFGVRVQFQIYASWFFVLAFAFSVVGVIKTIKQKCTNKNMVKTISECR